jgi:Uma2 family endonuclease
MQKSLSLVDQLYLVDGKAEIIRGEIVRMSPAGVRHGRRAGAIYRSLAHHEDEVGGGYAFPDNIGFIVDLPDRESFSPDAAWVVGELDEDDPRFYEGAPSFAVEVRSPDDYGPAAERAIASKIAEYFAAGTLVVWDVDLQSEELIKCYRASEPAHPQVFKRDDVANAEPAVASWRFPVKLLKRG